MPLHHPLPPEDITAYIDGELSQEERADVEAALAEHEENRQEINELRGLVSLLGGLSQYEPPRSLALSSEHIRDSAPRSNVVRLMPALRTLSVAAVVAFLLVSSFAVYDRIDSTDDSGNSANVRDAETSEPDNASLDSTGDTDPASGGLVDRGESAASNAMQPEAPSSSDAVAPGDSDIAQADATPTSTVAAPDEAPAASTSGGNSNDDDDNRWVISSAVLGVLSLILIGFWFYLGKRDGSKTGQPGEIAS